MAYIVGALVAIAIFLAVPFLLGRYLLANTRKRWIGYLSLILIGMPFSWTLLYAAGAASGGAVIPVPDVVAIFALFAGELRSSGRQSSGAIPPPFVMTTISSIVAYFIFRNKRPDLFKRSRT